MRKPIYIVGAFLLLVSTSRINAGSYWEDKPDFTDWKVEAKQAAMAQTMAGVVERLDSGIKASEIKPKLQVVKSSLQASLTDLELRLKQWTLNNLPIECRSASQDIATEILIKCAEQYFSFNGQPIHPLIINTLHTSLSDYGDQIVAINIYDSQSSNGFFSEEGIKIRGLRSRSEQPVIYISEHDEESGDRYGVGYRHIGKTDSGIHVVYAYYWGGGSYVHNNIILISIESDYGIVFDEKTSIIRETRPRLLLKKLGEFSLAYRWNGDLRVDGDTLLIGKDVGAFSDSRTDNKDTVITIDISR